METCMQIFRLGFAGTVNRFIYYLKRLPIIGKLIPDSLYAVGELKTALGIVSSVIDILKKLAGKLIYLLLMVFLPVYFLLSAEDKTLQTDALVHIFFFLSFLIGAVNSAVSLKNDVSVYNCVKLMKMNARRYCTTMILYKKLSEFLLFLPTLLIVGLFVGLPPLESILLSALMLCFRLGGEALSLLYFQHKAGLLYTNTWFLSCVYILGLAAAYLPVVFHHVMIGQRILFHPIVIILTTVYGILSLIYILHYPLFDKAVRTVVKMDDLTIDKEAIKNKVRFNDVQLTDKDFVQSSPSSLHLESKTGYDYLNALFFERHRRMLWKPVLIRIGIVAAVVIILMPIILIFPVFTADLNSHINQMLPAFVFIMYVISIGERVCRAMFYNCDISLLRYAYYRKPSVILHNFKIRLLRVAGMNLLIAAAICAGLSLLVLIAGGIPTLFGILPILLSILCLSLFFSVHYMFLYYVFQPYTTELNMKNPFYRILNGIVYIACYACFRMKSTPPFFAVIVIAATLIYIIVALILTYRLSPKTFRVK